MKKTNCRMCKSSNIQKFLDLGFSALSDNFLTFEQLEESEMTDEEKANFDRIWDTYQEKAKSFR